MKTLLAIFAILFCLTLAAPAETTQRPRRPPPNSSS